ncbi:MAG: hypothetical protein E7675_06090 [Ruminococcaceae bacterium]|nr:hypothetical protein [Oscillospiraceae bacterium]
MNGFLHQKKGHKHGCFYKNRVFLALILLITNALLLSSCYSGTGQPVFTQPSPLKTEETPLVHPPVTEYVTSSPDTTVVNTATPNTTPFPFWEFKQFTPEEKMICITFDDGPSIYTKRIIEKLKDTDSKVTFFVLGNRLEVSSSTWSLATKSAIENGHEIGFHSYTHKENYTDLSDAELSDHINKTNEHLSKLGGEPVTLIRPVGGFRDKTKNYGYPCILWNVDVEDWRVNSSIKNGSMTYDEGVKILADMIVKQASSGSIVLLHDIYECSVDAFCLVYDKLSAEGYKFVTVSEMLGIEGKDASGYAFYSTYTAYYLDKRCS